MALKHYFVLSGHVDLITMSKIISRLLEKFQKSEYRSREADLTACIYKDFMMFLCFFSIPRTSTKELTNTVFPDDCIFDLIDTILQVEAYPKLRGDYNLRLCCLKTIEHLATNIDKGADESNSVQESIVKHLFQR